MLYPHQFLQPILEVLLKVESMIVLFSVHQQEELVRTLSVEDNQRLIDMKEDLIV